MIWVVCELMSLSYGIMSWLLKSYHKQVRLYRDIAQGQYWFGTVYPKKYAHSFCFTVLCCGYTLTDFPTSIRLTSLALWQSNDCPSASKATLMNMDKYFMWIHYERLHNDNKAKNNKTVCVFLGIYCMSRCLPVPSHCLNRCRLIICGHCGTQVKPHPQKLFRISFRKLSLKNKLVIGLSHLWRAEELGCHIMLFQIIFAP